MIQILAYLLLVAFFAADAMMRKGEPARSLATTATDKGSTMLIGECSARFIPARCERQKPRRS